MLMETTRSKSQNRNALNQDFNELGRLAPQAIDIEEIVLGALMLERSAIDNVELSLLPETFYKPTHQIIYKAISSLYKRNEPVDIMTVTNELRTSNELETVGGPYYITQLTSRIASSANIEYYVSILVEKFMLRSLIRVCSEAINITYTEGCDPFDTIEKTDKDISQILEQTGNFNTLERIDVSLQSACDSLKKRVQMAKQGKATGIDTGINSLNKLTGGWQNSDLIILAARPGMGKTALMLHHAISAAFSGIPVCIFSLEMTAESLVNRLFPSLCEIDLEHFKSGFMNSKDWEESNRAIEIISKLPIYIDPQSGITMRQIKTKSRIMKKKGQCGLIMIDYLQLVEMSSERTNRNREQEVAEASRQAKIIAKELDVPVILLCQLSRKVEDRKDCRPMLSDLRESGAIEQDADLVIFIYRPEYYGYEENSIGESLIGVGELLIEKHRNGATGKTMFHYNSSLTKITDPEANTCNF